MPSAIILLLRDFEGDRWKQVGRKGWGKGVRGLICCDSAVVDTGSVETGEESVDEQRGQLCDDGSSWRAEKASVGEFQEVTS